MSEIELDGTVNTRDVGGLPLADGSGKTRTGVLLRSDNLQALTATDVRRLLDDLRVRRVVDLRTGVEVRGEGPGPLTREVAVRIEHLSLFPEVGRTTDAGAQGDGAGGDPGAGTVSELVDEVLPWARKPGERRHREPADDVREWSASPVARVYLRYLRQRPDSLVAALRAVAEAADDGAATLVHCAAGKDRTGVVVALSLDLVGVDRDAIDADYLATVPNAAAILDRLQASPTYADDVAGTTVAEHAPRPETMPDFLAGLDEHFGGVATFLSGHGWTGRDTGRLREALLG